MKPVTIIGSYLSPYVRKVLVSLHCKQIPYEIDPIVPFFGNDRFSELSPVRRIPVLIDDRVTLCDSSVICQYLEDRHPEPSLYPRDVADRARRSRARGRCRDGQPSHACRVAVEPLPSGTDCSALMTVPPSTS